MPPEEPLIPAAEAEEGTAVGMYYSSMIDLGVPRDVAAVMLFHHWGVKPELIMASPFDHTPDDDDPSEPVEPTLEDPPAEDTADES